MKAARFIYHRPDSLTEAAALLDEHADDAKVLAGGQSLVPLLALRLASIPHLVDVNWIPELDQVTEEEGSVTIGAVTRQARVEHDELVARRVPLLSRALPLIGHFQIRNRGTVGGSLAHADPASELPAVACALGATFEVHGLRGRRTVAARDFFRSTWETAIAPNELLHSVSFPASNGRSGAAIREIGWRRGDFAVAGAAAAVALDGSDRITSAGIALFGMGPTPVRADAAEAALLGENAVSPDLSSVAELALEGATPVDDVHASAAYRREVCRRLVETTLTDALEEARRG